VTLAVQEIASGLSAPLFLASPPGDARLFVVEQPGRIRLIRDGALLPRPFLDIAPLVGSGGERGLLSVAFHPRYAQNGYFYVNYTDLNGDTRIERYAVDVADPDAADPTSARLILGVDQPYSNHNGGLVMFGPDGMLYVGMGDGGSGGDPQGNGQSLNTHLGKLLRLDVDGGDPYAVPSDNPFFGQPGPRAEIWAIGLRNPWRFSFDAESGLLFIGDVGQNAWEEVDVAPADQPALNFGWSVMEGAHCLGASSCDQSGLTLPVHEYPNPDEGCSVIGGYVYRGTAIPEIAGHYFYSDLCDGRIRSFRYENGTAVDAVTRSVGDLGTVLSFGVDDDGELYVLSQNGRVFRIVAQR
jgi:glucose/arabinose dehydrogenase